MPKPQGFQLTAAERRWFTKIGDPEYLASLNHGKGMPGGWAPYEVTRSDRRDEEGNTRLALILAEGLISEVKYRPEWFNKGTPDETVYVLTDKGREVLAQWQAYAAELKDAKPPALPTRRQRIVLELAARPQGATRGEIHNAVAKAGYSRDTMALVGLLNNMLDIVKNKAYPNIYSWMTIRMEVVGERSPKRKNTPIAVYYATVRGRTVLVESTRKVDPRWLTTNVVDLARVAWQDNDETVATILLDALADAGCPDPKKFRYKVIHKIIFAPKPKE